MPFYHCNLKRFKKKTGKDLGESGEGAFKFNTLKRRKIKLLSINESLG